MKITSFLLSADSKSELNEQGENVITLIKPLALLRPPTIPGVFSFTMTITLVGLDISEKHSMRVSLYDPDDDKLQTEVTSELHDTSSNAKNDTAPIDYKGCTISIDFRNFPLTKAGWYTAKIEIDSETYSQTFGVYQGKL